MLWYNSSLKISSSVYTICGAQYRPIVDAEAAVESIAHAVGSAITLRPRCGHYASRRFCISGSRAVTMVTWVAFDGAGAPGWLAVQAKSNILFLSPFDGTQVEATLPFSISTAWPCSLRCEGYEGLLLYECDASRCFTVTHPLRDPVPVEHVDFEVLNDDDSRQSLGRVIFVSREPPTLIVTYIISEQAHALWCQSFEDLPRKKINNPSCGLGPPLDSSNAPQHAKVKQLSLLPDTFHFSHSRQCEHAVMRRLTDGSGGSGKLRASKSSSRVFRTSDDHGALFLHVILAHGTSRNLSLYNQSKYILYVQMQLPRLNSLSINRVDGSGPWVSFNIVNRTPCLDAIPLPLQTRYYAASIVILRENGDLVFTNCQNSISAIVAPSLLFCPFHEAQSQVMRLCDQDGTSRVVLQLKGNKSCICVSTCVSFESKIVEATMAVLIETLPADLILTLYVTTPKSKGNKTICRRVAMAKAVRALCSNSNHLVLFEVSWYAFTLALDIILGIPEGGQNGSSSNITDAWQMLGASELHRLQQVQSIDVRDILPMVGEKYAPACSIVKKPLSSLRQYVQMHISPVLFKNAIGKALRAVYREFKVSKLTWKYLNRIRMLLCRLQYGSAGLPSNHSKAIPKTDRHLSYQVGVTSCTADYDTSKITHDTYASGCTAASALVLRMAYSKYSAEDLDLLPTRISLPLHGALQYCHARPLEEWPCSAYDLLGRNDLLLVANFACGQYQTRDMFEDKRALVFWDRAYTALLFPPRADIDAADDACSYGLIKDDESDGLAQLEDSGSLQFSDTRVREVSRLFRCSDPVFLRLDRPPEMADHEFEQRKQGKLLLACARSCASIPGRGMITLGSFALQRTLAESLPASDQCLTYKIQIHVRADLQTAQAPKICLLGRLSPANTTFALDISASGADTFNVWPSFHNGVAAGLRIQPWISAAFCPSRQCGQPARVTRTWIIYNRPQAPSPQHGGLLLALGLQSHLDVLAMTDIYEYLTSGHEPTTVGILLGMAAARRGTADTAVSKMLCLHIPSLLPQPFAEMEVSAAAQTAAMTGIGLVYSGTAHRLMAEFLLGEISHRTHNDRIRNREAYALAAGLALGMITLGRGGTHETAGLSDLKIAQRLHRALAGGQTVKSLFHESRDPYSILASNHLKCSRVREGEQINTDMTAPGAIIAMGLYYIQTNSIAAAARLELPETHILLNGVRPDLQLLRTVARSIILWDAVEPSIEWIESQLPRVLTSPPPANNDRGQVHCASHFALMPASLRHVTGLPATDLSIADLNAMSQTHGRRPDQALLELCLSTTSVALGMVMAGTGDFASLKLLRRLRWCVDDGMAYGTHMALQMSIGFLFMGGGRASLSRSKESIAALLAACFPRFPKSIDDNQYHLQPLRHLWVMAVSWRGLKTVDADTGKDVVVPLLVELNACVDYTAETAHVPATKRRIVTPCLLPPLKDISCVCINSERSECGILLPARLCLIVKRRPGYSSFSRDPYAPPGMGCETGHREKEYLRIRHVLAPWAHAQPTNSIRGRVRELENELIAIVAGTRINDDLEYTADPLLVTFSRHFCDAEASKRHSASRSQIWGGGKNATPLGIAPSSIGRWCMRVLYTCVATDKPTALPLYIQLHYSALVFSLTRQPRQWLSLCAVIKYASMSPGNQSTKLLSGHFVSALKVHVQHVTSDNEEWWSQVASELSLAPCPCPIEMGWSTEPDIKKYPWDQEKKGHYEADIEKTEASIEGSTS